jgi:hypothetical protein
LADEESPSADLEPAKPAAAETPPADFAPTDYTDGRRPLDWRSKYPADARKQIRFEATYLATLLLFLPAIIIVLLSGIGCERLPLDCRASGEGCKYLFAFLGGALGGSLFATKWLYHSVAKRIWHVDRRLWRLFTPVLSAGLAFGTTLLIKANVISIFSQQALDSPQAILAISFLVGYFSDNATAKLTEVAETVFGATRERRQPPNDDSGTSAGAGSAPPHNQH